MTVEALGQRIIDHIGVPKDAWEIAAQLEVLGLRDSDARSTYGAHDLFDLARLIDHQFRGGGYSFHIEGEDPRPRVIPFFRFVRRYLAGITFATPMALQAATMLIWGYGIWGAIDLELWQGSAIALGFIASYIVAGGFAQSIVRRGLFYVYQQEPVLARWTALRGFSIALRSMLALIVPAIIVNAVFGILPWSMTGVAIAYYAGLGILWLSWALIYLTRKTWLLIPITIAALAAVIAAAKLGHVSPIGANAIGVATADLVSFGIAYLLLLRLAQRQADPVNPPRVAVLVHSTSRYFVYGLLFNAFLFTDRVIAWTTDKGRLDFPPYAFWLSVRYELAMDLALIVALIMSGVVEFAIERFSDELVPLEKSTLWENANDFITEQLRMHRRRFYELIASAVVALAVASATFVALRGVPNQHLHEAMTAEVTVEVFVAAAVGYLFLMFAIRNLLLLLTLSRIEEAVRSVAIALAVDVVAGFVCSRAINYSAAVIGLVAGAIVMSILASRATRRVIARLDYFYYAAF